MKKMEDLWSKLVEFGVDPLPGKHSDEKFHYVQRKIEDIIGAHEQCKVQIFRVALDRCNFSCFHFM